MTRKITGLISTLNDSCFVQAGECLTELCEMIEDESGVKPSLNDLCEILTVSLQGCSGDLLSDVNVQFVEKLTPKVAPHKRIKLTPGDILAIPRRKGGYYFVIFITSNRFGEAFGIFAEHRKVPYVSPKWKPTPLKYPVYSEDGPVLKGRWRRVGNREDLLKLFPKSPEIFHEPSDDPEDEEIGPYGCGETAAEKLRDLTEREAKEIGLIQGTYLQTMSGETFEEYLKDTLDGKKRHDGRR